MARTFKVHFPDRINVQPVSNHTGCCMVTCTVGELPRGTYDHVQGVDARDVWDKLHRLYPFERINVLEPL